MPASLNIDNSLTNILMKTKENVFKTDATTKLQALSNIRAFKK